MKKLTLTVATLILMTACATTKKTVSATEDSAVAVHTVRKLVVDDSVMLSRQAEWTVERPRMIICRHTPTDTVVTVIEADRLVARDSITAGNVTTVIASDTTAVAGLSRRESHTDTRRTPGGNLLYVVLALLAGLFIGLSLRGIGSRR